MKLKLYETSDSNNLAYLLIEMKSELYDSLENIDLDRFVKTHDYIYLLVVNDEIVGFSSYVISDNCGMSDKKLINSFLFIDKRYRKTKALMLLIRQTGEIIDKLGINVQFPTINKELVAICDKFGAKNVYNVAEYSFSDYRIAKKRLNKILYRKD